jgi:hypothetical protein
MSILGGVEVSVDLRVRFKVGDILGECDQHTRERGWVAS